MRKFTLILVTLTIVSCAQETEAPQLKTARIERRDIVVSVQAAGIIEPEKAVEVKSKASGEILDLRTETGVLVEAGELLVQIDKRTPRNMFSQATAELEAAIARRDIAKSQTDRAKKLFDSGTFNQVDLEQTVLEYANAKAEVVRAEVAVENARIALDDTEVRAPITGTIILKYVETGQVISSPTQDVGGGTPLLEMADLTSVQVKALVDETDIGKIQPGQPATVTVAAYPNQPFSGEVLKIEPQALDEEAVTMFSVLVTIDNRDGLLRPGMNAEVDMSIASRIDVPAIPSLALRTPKDITAAALFLQMEENEIRARLGMAGTVSGASEDVGGNDEEVPAAEGGSPARTGGYMFGGDYWVFVIRDGQPVATSVRTGLTDLEYSEVLSGLEESDVIVILPSSGLIMSQQQFRKFMGDAFGVPGIKQKEE